MIYLVTAAFISMTLDGVTLSRTKSYEIHVNVSITIKVLGGVSFHVTVINWQQLKDTLGFSSFLGCLNQNRILLTRDLLPNISLVIG